MRSQRLVLLVLLGAGSATALGGVNYSISRWTVDGGGGELDGGVFALRATLGQPDVGSASGDGFAVNGGFWASRSTPPDVDAIFHDGFESSL